MTISNREEEKDVRWSHYSRVSGKSRAYQRHVEIATLTLPAKAHARVESGDTSTFILEAPSHVIDHLVDNDQLSELRNATYRSSEISHSKTTNPHIEGVVDMEMISHLVTGVTESEFVNLLQPDLAHAEHGAGVKDEPSQNDEESQLLRQSTNEDTYCIAVPSDPFLNVTAEFHEEVSVEYAGLSSINETKVSSNHSPYPMGAENANGDNISSQKEAYLLSIPTTEGGDIDCNAFSRDGDTSVKAEDSVFLLAVPEMTATSGSIRSSAITHNTLYTSVDDLQNRIEHPFTPLPTDVHHIELRVSTAITTDGSALHHPEEEGLHLDLVVDRKVPAIGYIILVGGLFALSSIGVALDLQRGGVAPEMKAFWRFTATSIMFLFLSAKSLSRDEFAKFTRLELWVLVPLAGVSYGFTCVAFVVALEMTSLVNAFILSNLASLIIIGSKVVLRKPVLFLEGAGAAIGMTGALFCAYAGSDNSEDHSSGLAMAGNVLAFLASVATALYLTLAKSLRSRVDLFVFMLLIFTYASAAVLLYMIFMGEPYKISIDSTIGLFGWVHLQMDRLPLELWMVIVCNLLGTAGYLAVLKYFDPVVVSMVMLMEPIVASVMGSIAGVSSLPSLMTWAGDGVVMVGSILVILSGSKKTETIDATNALKKVNEELALEGNPVLLRRSSMSTKTPTLKRSVVLHNPQKKNALQKERKAAQEESYHNRDASMEFVFVGNKSRDTTVSSIRDSGMIRGIRLPGTETSISNLEL